MRLAAVMVVLLFAGCLQSEPQVGPSDPAPAAGAEGADPATAGPVGATSDGEVDAEAVPPVTTEVDGSISFYLQALGDSSPEVALAENGPYEIPADVLSNGVLFILRWTPSSPLTEAMRIELGTTGYEGTPPLRVALAPPLSEPLEVRVLPSADSPVTRAGFDQPFVLSWTTFANGTFDADLLP